MNTPEHPIFLQSIEYIRSKIGLTGLDCVQQSVLERIIHSSGDLSIQSCLRFSPKACENAIIALKKGATILTDTYMAASAVSSVSRRTLNSNVQCVLERAPECIDSSSQTRTAIGMRRMWLDLEKKEEYSEGPVVLIGSAPTALMALLDLIKEGTSKPSLIIGMPVGFIGVSESKTRLLKSNLSYIVLEGSKGGASLAAAAVNALLKAVDY